MQAVHKILRKVNHIDKYENAIFENKQKVYSFLNPYSYDVMRNNTEAYKDLDGVFFDGILVCYFYHLFYGIKITRRSFDMTSLAKSLFDRCNQTEESLYILGSQSAEIKKAVSIYLEKYSNLNIVKYRNGYFANDIEMRETIKDIIDKSPKFVIVGMGAVRQEIFLCKLKNSGFQGIGFSCGGFIHQSTEKLDYFPRWSNQLHLRWLVRVFQEKETRKRFFTSLLKFPFTFTWDFIKYKQLHK